VCVCECLTCVLVGFCGLGGVGCCGVGVGGVLILVVILCDLSWGCGAEDEGVGVIGGGRRDIVRAQRRGRGGRWRGCDWLAIGCVCGVMTDACWELSKNGQDDKELFMRAKIGRWVGWDAG